MAEKGASAGMLASSVPSRTVDPTRPVKLAWAVAVSILAVATLAIPSRSKEPREVTARSDTRLLLVLAPWPGDGHPGAMSLEEKAQARERASARGGE